MTENETRAAGGSIEARRSKRADGTDARVIGGSAIVYNSPSRDLGGFVEYIDPGSVLTTDWTNALLNHDQHFLLGTLRAGTLRLTDSRTSLDYEVDVPDHRTDVYELVARGDIRDSSFAFSSREETWDWDSEDYAVRRVHERSEVNRFFTNRIVNFLERRSAKGDGKLQTSSKSADVIPELPLFNFLRTTFSHQLGVKW